MTNEKRFFHHHITKLTYSVKSYREEDWSGFTNRESALVRVTPKGKLMYIDFVSSHELFEDIRTYCIEQGIIKPE